MTPRALRYLHSFGAIFALLAAVALGLIALSPAGRALMPPVALVGAIVLLVGYVLYAKRRTTALLQAEERQSHEEADRAFAELSATPALTTGVALRWRARTYVLTVFVLLVGATVAVLGWSEGAWVVAAGGGLMFLWVAKTLLGRLAEPEVLLVGPQGIDDRMRFGLIPWQDIDGVFFQEREVKGTKVATLSIDVRNPEAYLQRLGPLARLSRRGEMLGFDDGIPLQLHGLDMAPRAVFRLIRAFHEKAVPSGAIEGNDNLYRVDAEGAKLKTLMADFEASPARASHDELLARTEALAKRNRERLVEVRARVRKTQWMAIAVVIAFVVVLVLALDH